MLTVHSVEVLLPRWLYKTYRPERELFKFGFSAVLLSSCQCGERIKHTYPHLCGCLLHYDQKGTNRTQSQTQSRSLHRCVFIISAHTAEKGRTKIKREGGRAGEMKWIREKSESKRKMPTKFKSLSSVSFWQRSAKRQILKCFAHTKKNSVRTNTTRSGCHAPFLFWRGGGGSLGSLSAPGKDNTWLGPDRICWLFLHFLCWFWRKICRSLRNGFKHDKMCSTELKVQHFYGLSN